MNFFFAHFRKTKIKKEKRERKEEEEEEEELFIYMERCVNILMSMGFFTALHYNVSCGCSWEQRQSIKTNNTPPFFFSLSLFFEINYIFGQLKNSTLIYFKLLFKVY